MPSMFTRIKVEDYDAWKQAFDEDAPGARRSAEGHRVFRGLEDPNEVFIAVQFASSEEAGAARRRLEESGVLDRVNVQNGPTIVEEAEAVTY